MMMALLLLPLQAADDPSPPADRSEKSPTLLVPRLRPPLLPLFLHLLRKRAKSSRLASIHAASALLRISVRHAVVPVPRQGVHAQTVRQERSVGARISNKRAHPSSKTVRPTRNLITCGHSMPNLLLQRQQQLHRQCKHQQPDAY